MNSYQETDSPFPSLELSAAIHSLSIDEGRLWAYQAFGIRTHKPAVALPDKWNRSTGFLSQISDSREFAPDPPAWQPEKTKVFARLSKSEKARFMAMREPMAAP